MAEVVLFHHAQGLTRGVRAFADELREAGHIVHTPDLYEGATFATLDEGVAHMKQVGFDSLIERSRGAVESMPNELVYAGMSMGAAPAQMYAQTRPGAAGAVLMSGVLPASEFGGKWPAGVPLQVHGMENDPWFLEDVAAAKELAALAGGELFLYPGDKHLFADSSLADYDQPAARLLMLRVLGFLQKK